MAASQQSSFDQPIYTDAVVDILGAFAYGELSAFWRVCEDASMAPSLWDQMEMSRLAVVEFSKVTLLSERLSDFGVEPSDAMAPFRAPFEKFHSLTKPSDWWEGLVKVYVGDGIARDFYREIANHLDPKTREVVAAATADAGHAAYAVQAIRLGTSLDPTLGGRLALWGRRLMGEALAQAQHVVADRETLADLLTSGTIVGLDLAAMTSIFANITEQHVLRMQALGLDH
ncbi:MAG: ferritin-like fold-containing protein [Nocardioides sp.]